MKKISAIIILNIFYSISNAQNPNLDYKYSLLISNLSRMNIHSNTDNYDSQHNYYVHQQINKDFLHPVIGVQLKTKRDNFWEFTLNDLRFGNNHHKTEIRNDSTGNTKIIEEDEEKEYRVALNCEYTFVFFKKKEKRLVPSVSVGLAPYYNENDIEPVVSTSYPIRDLEIGLRTMVSPGITFYTKHRMFLNAKIPLCLNNAQFRMENREDPTITSNERKNSSFDLNFFPIDFAFKVGIGIKL